VIGNVAGEGLAVVVSLHDNEDVVVVVPIDQLDQCSRSQEEVGNAELVVMASLHDDAESVVTALLVAARVDDRCWEEL